MRKAIMRRSYLENIYFKKRTDKSVRAYKKQKNYCSRLYKKERKKFLYKLNLFFVNDNKLLWKTVKALFSNNPLFGSNIKLVEKDEVLQYCFKYCNRLLYAMLQKKLKTLTLINHQPKTVFLQKCLK